MSVVIFCGCIQVNSINGNASYNQGTNVAHGWEYFAKSNNAFGSIAGNLNTIPCGANILYDPDLLDTNMPGAGSFCPSASAIVET